MKQGNILGVWRHRSRRVRVIQSLLAAGALVVGTATAAAAVSHPVSSPCGATISWTNTTSTQVSNSSCQYVQAVITRYYAGKPVTYTGNMAVMGATSSVSASNGSCIDHRGNLWAYGGGSQQYTYSC